MPITLGSNTPSMGAQRRLADGTQQLAKTYERLASGLRINRASDDAAGLAISESLKSDQRIFNQGIRNLNDGISMLAIADSAIGNLSDIVVRLNELAEQSANGVYSINQRKALDNEAQALSKEYSRIIQTTQFNGLNVLTANGDGIRLQAGYGVSGSLLTGVGGAVGLGTFNFHYTYATETGSGGINGSRGLTLGDLNGDGVLDLVTAGYVDTNGPGYMTVRLGIQGGTFGAAASYATGASFGFAATVGDVNGDGILDVVTAGNDSPTGEASVRLGRGDGTLGAATIYSQESVATLAVKLADLNSDGNLDLITGGSGGSGGQVSIRLGTSGGTFGASATYLADPNGVRGVAFGDLNGDGILDMATSGTNGSTGTATVRFGNGDGGFGSVTQYDTLGTSGRAIAIGDLNGDGKLDLVTTGYSGGGGHSSVLINSGDGTFGAATTYVAESTQSLAIALGDLNGDGFLDMVSSGQGASTMGTIRLGLGNGSFSGATTLALANSSRALALGDINGDGVLDIVTAGNGAGNSGAAKISLAQTVSGVSPLLPFDLSTMGGARQALPVFSNKLNQLAAQRGTVGAFQSRIGVAVNVLGATTENYAAAEGRIRDSDIAEESSQLIRRNILQQAAASVLGQANIQPELALRLITG